jgi:hypothetical protein
MSLARPLGPCWCSGAPSVGDQGGLLAGEHPADQRPPGDRTNDAVDGELQGLLEAADRGVGLEAEDPVDLQSLVGVAGEVAELELLLDRPHRVPLAPLPDLDDQGRPGIGADDAVDGQSSALLEGANRGVGPGPEDPVDRDAVAAGSQQVLQAGNRMTLVAASNQRQTRTNRSLKPAMPPNSPPISTTCTRTRTSAVPPRSSGGRLASAWANASSKLRLPENPVASSAPGGQGRSALPRTTSAYPCRSGPYCWIGTWSLPSAWWTVTWSWPAGNGTVSA